MKTPERLHAARSVPPDARARRFASRAPSVGVSVLLSLLVSSSVASAQFTRDRSAKEQINKTIAQQYLKMNYGQAEEQLLAIVSACEDKCRPGTIARAWMYVGLVRGSGKGDQHGAREAFVTAVAQDPRVELDDALATPETQATFDSARKSGPETDRQAPLIGASPLGGASASDAPAADDKSKRTGLRCTPGARSVQTRRPIPFDCQADEEVVRMSLRYQEHGGAQWKTLEMQRAGESFRATIPCESTMDSGKVNFFIVATDGAGDPLDTLGSKGDPQRLTIDPQSTEAPAFPGEEPPARCAEKVMCPPDFPGCDDPVSQSEAEAEAQAEANDRISKNWLGLHFAADFGFIGGADVCTTENRDFDCFASDSPYPSELPASVAAEPGELGDAYPGTGIGTGASAGTLRVLLSYDRALSERISLGARLGYAFGGGPETLDGRAFLPIHAEGRATYWLRGLHSTGLRPYVHLGGGIAQVDIKKGDVTVRDCSEENGRQAFLDCIAAENAYDSANQPELPEKTLDAYRKLGNAFVTAGGGVSLSLGERTALQLNLNAMLMLPSTGFVLQPGLGLVYGL